MRSRQIWPSAVSGAPAGTIARAAWEAACAVYLMRDAIRQALRSPSEVIRGHQRPLPEYMLAPVQHRAPDAIRYECHVLQVYTRPLEPLTNLSALAADPTPAIAPFRIQSAWRRGRRRGRCGGAAVLF